MGEPERVVYSSGGWAWPLLSKKSHYFSPTARSLCGRWMYSGLLDRTRTMDAAPGPDDCVACWRKRAKRIAESEVSGG